MSPRYSWKLGRVPFEEGSVSTVGPSSGRPLPLTTQEPATYLIYHIVPSYLNVLTSHHHHQPDNNVLNTPYSHSKMSAPPRETRFHEEASQWDSNPSVQRATSLAHQALLSRLSSSPKDIPTYDVLEIGCGTGLLSLSLAPSVRSITAVDAARGMIDVLKSKLETTHTHIKNVLPVSALLEDPNDERIQLDPVNREPTPENRRFDLITSHLVLHHIPDLQPLLSLMFAALKPSTGKIMLTDYESFGPEARKFHPESKMDEVERHGIERAEMTRLMEDAGFVDIKAEVAFEMEKPIETFPGSGIMEGKMTFPFLVCEGRRP
ncbi:S-adenosyl-L-methionine-dependent methyltransferase [Rhypophila sp. PSN 637]